MSSHLHDDTTGAYFNKMKSFPLYPRVAMPRLALMTAVLPMGMPATSTVMNSENDKLNCWVASTTALLASDPFVALFVLDVWSRESNTVRWAPMQQQPANIKKRLVLEPGDYAIAILLMECIWLVNWGDEQTSDKYQLKKVSASLYKQLMEIRSADVVNDRLADARTDAYDPCVVVMRKAMFAWWDPYLADMYDKQCNIKGVRTNTCIVPHANEAERCPVIYQSFGEEGEVESVVLSTVGKEFVDLNYFITSYTFNNAVEDKKTSRDGVKIIDTHNGAENLNSLFSCIKRLPWRFSVMVNRTDLLDVNAKPSAAPVCYNPMSLVVGPTFRSNEWANYRLVGRLVHKNDHWTSSVVQLNRRVEAFSRAKLNAYPAMISYDWHKATEETKAKSPNRYDDNHSLFYDVDGVMLIFEMYQ